MSIVGPIISLKHLDRQVGLESTYYIFQLIKRAVCWPDAVNKVRFSCWPKHDSQTNRWVMERVLEARDRPCRPPACWSTVPQQFNFKPTILHSITQVYSVDNNEERRKGCYRRRCPVSWSRTNPIIIILCYIFHTTWFFRCKHLSNVFYNGE